MRMTARLHAQSPHPEGHGYLSEDWWLAETECEWDPVAGPCDVMVPEPGLCIGGVSIWDDEGRLLQWSGFDAVTPNHGDLLRLPGFDLT